MGLGRFMGLIEEKELNWVDTSGLAFYFVLGCLAQSVEQLTLNQRVEGSSPSASTKFWRDMSAGEISAHAIKCSSDSRWGSGCGGDCGGE